MFHFCEGEKWKLWTQKPTNIPFSIYFHCVWLFLLREKRKGKLYSNNINTAWKEAMMLPILFLASGWENKMHKSVMNVCFLASCTEFTVYHCCFYCDNQVILVWHSLLTTVSAGSSNQKWEFQTQPISSSCIN